MPLQQLDDEVIRKAQRGDRDAFALIVRTYEVPVYNHVLRLVNDRSLAEDLTQDVFLRVYQNLSRFSFNSKFTTWLFRVTVNRVVDEIRAQERRPRSTVLPTDESLRVADTTHDEAETVDAIWRAVAKLNPDLKSALLMRDVAGLSYNEIAEALEVTLMTVKWRIYKAREEVQLAVAREGIVFTGERERTTEAAGAA